MNILDKIIFDKKKEIDQRSLIVPLERLKESQRLSKIRNFKKAISSKMIDVISEIKLRSPSEKNIMTNADPVCVAKTYAENGAAAISVLTDQKYFGGNIDFIHQVRNAVEIPVLRKDFIISEYQVWESYYIGADAILLIADAINQKELTDLYELSMDLGLHVLVESHSVDSISLINKLNPEIVGMNCRNLETMQTNLNLFEKVYKDLPSESIKVAESGINVREDLMYIYGLGYDSALIGTSLMKSGEPGRALAEILNRVYL